jgi:uncharacterized membrane protein HdeD (DUF308 family)
VRVALIKNWWSLVLRGVIGVVLGIVTFIWPGLTLASIVILFGAYSFLDGVVSIAGAVRAVHAHDRWGSLVIKGLLGIAVAIMTIAWPAMTLLALVYLMGAWAMVTGIFEIVTAIRLRRHIPGEWLLVIGGIASVVFGFLVMLVPLAGALVLALWFGAYLLVTGIILITLGIRLRGLRNAVVPGSPMTAPAH